MMSEEPAKTFGTTHETITILGLDGRYPSILSISYTRLSSRDTGGWSQSESLLTLGVREVHPGQVAKKTKKDRNWK